jgi:hypothetical protein
MTAGQNPGDAVLQFGDHRQPLGAVRIVRIAEHELALVHGRIRRALRRRVEERGERGVDCLGRVWNASSGRQAAAHRLAHILVAHHQKELCLRCGVTEHRSHGDIRTIGHLLRRDPGVPELVEQIARGGGDPLALQLLPALTAPCFIRHE